MRILSWVGATSPTLDILAAAGLGGFAGVGSVAPTYARWRSFRRRRRSEEHTSELQSLMRISYAVLGWQNKKCRAIPVTPVRQDWQDRAAAPQCRRGGGKDEQT